MPDSEPDATTAPPGRVSRRHLISLAAGTAAAATLAGAAEPAEAGGRRRSSVGFVLAHEQFPAQDLVHWAGQAEAAGFGAVWTSDHIQPWEDVQGHSMHPWETQSLIARTTRRIRFGTGVTCPIYRHHPSSVAQAWASLGKLAPGRVFLGVGTGEALNERAATGQFGRYPERAARLIEAVRLIRRLWTGERTTFEGRYYRTDQFKLYDLPSRPVPILLAASGPTSAYNAGRYGDGWIGSAKDQQDPELLAAFRRGARDAGKDPDGLTRYAELFVNAGWEDLRYAAERWRFTVDPWTPELLYEPNPVRIQQKAEQRWTLPQVYGPWPKGRPEAHIEAVQGLLDAGVTPFVHSGQRDQAGVIRFYRDHVLPHVH